MSDRPDDDLLSELLRHFGVRASVFRTPNVCGAWQINTTGMARASYHLLTHGSAWLHTRDQAEPLAMRAGDLLFLPHDTWHVLSAESKLTGEHAALITEGPGPRSTLVCGRFDFHSTQGKHLLSSLPPWVLVRAEHAEAGMAQLVRALSDESARGGPGSRAVLDTLSDALLVMLLRHAVLRVPLAPGVLAAFTDARLVPVLSAVHREPAQAWSVQAMAGRALMSRTAFIERFQSLVGVPPMRYVTELRMQLAERWLRDDQLGVAQVAERCGYETEAAFRKAFRRERGITPAAARKARAH